MKKIQNLKFLWLSIIGVTLFACDGFTEVDLPQTQLTGEVVYQDEVTATAALMNIYAKMRENGLISGNADGLTQLMGLYSDELVYYGSATAAADSFFNHTVIPSNDYVTSLWLNGYSQIYAANALLEGLSKSSSINEKAKEVLRGEALFIRAFLHFYLTNLYGDIPYITTTDYLANSKVSRMPFSVVLDKINIDLKEAKQLLPNQYVGVDRVRINKATVQALLARMYLYQKQWSMAESEATDVISNTGLYNMVQNLDAVFLKNSSSTIWQLHAGIAGGNTNDARYFIFASGPPAVVAISQNLISAFESNDLRKQSWIKSVTTGSNTWYHPYKYKQNANTGVSKEYSIMFRLEEQYLIRAEARAHQNNLIDARKDLNKIRSRAGLTENSSTSQQDLLQGIYDERRLELFTELGHRWFDLERTGKAATVLPAIKLAWQNSDRLLPLPESELLVNSNLKPQNPGY